MSRIHRNPAPSTTRRAPMTRSSPCTSTADHCTPCRARAPIRGRTMYTRPQQQARTDNNPHNGESGTEPQERTVHVGSVDLILKFMFKAKVVNVNLRSHLIVHHPVFFLYDISTMGIHINFRNLIVFFPF